MMQMTATSADTSLPSAENILELFTINYKDRTARFYEWVFFIVYAATGGICVYRKDQCTETYIKLSEFTSFPFSIGIYDSFHSKF